ncbi:MAG: CoA transferase [Chloroflexi bacterium]|nr:CoA transferase [Chloroflexota bacterium]
MTDQQASRPLAGIRVLDLTQMAAGPFATMLFADAGAEIIKVERPDKGDLMREFGPFLPADAEHAFGGGFLRHNRNKRSMTLNLRSPGGQALFRELVRHADVVWENFAPGTMEKFGLGYEHLREINPRLVYAAISGYGHTDILASPFWRRPAFDGIAQALGGLVDITGQPGGPPTLVGTIVGDIVPGLFCAYGVLVALRGRELTGRGQLVDVAMVDSMVSLCERLLMTYSMTKEVPPRGQDNLAAPYGVFPCKDGYVVITAAPHGVWTRLCQVMGREDLITDPRTATAAARAVNSASYLTPIIVDWLKDKTKAEVDAVFAEGDVPGSPVLTIPEVFDSPHVAARQMLLEYNHPVLGKLKVAGNPVKLSELPTPPAELPPRLGEHTDEVLRDLLGFDAARVAALRAEGVI